MEFAKPERNKPKTLLLPGLIVLIVIALVIFFLKGDPPEKGTESSPFVAKPIAEPRPAPGEIELELRSFTPWMTPSEIDAHIRLLNGTDETSFWDKGHWIIGAEGRWENGTHEFRIAYDTSPPEGTYAWKYKINLKQDEFSRSIDQFLAEGYSLAYSQSFTRPDDTKRYQGVWHQLSEAALPQIENAYEAEEIIESDGTPTAVPEPDADSEDPLSQLNGQDFRDASGN